MRSIGTAGSGRPTGSARATAAGMLPCSTTRVSVIWAAAAGAARAASRMQIRLGVKAMGCSLGRGAERQLKTQALLEGQAVPARYSSGYLMGIIGPPFPELKH